MPLERANSESTPSRRGSVWVVAGVVGGVGLLLLGGLFVGMVMMLAKSKDMAGRRVTELNARQVCISAESSNDTYGRMGGPFGSTPSSPLFGDAPTVTPPTDLDARLSWRVDILPYLEQGHFHSRFDYSEAWDSPANLSAGGVPVRAFLDPLDPADHQTRFRCFYNNGALWDTDPAKRMSLAAIPDGSSNTILFVDATERVPWAQFNEFKYNPTGPRPELGHPQRTAFAAGMADGSVRWVKKTVSVGTLRAAITRAGGESLGPDFAQE